MYFLLKNFPINEDLDVDEFESEHSSDVEDNYSDMDEKCFNLMKQKENALLPVLTNAPIKIEYISLYKGDKDLPLWTMRI
jgi:hypothetical protein